MYERPYMVLPPIVEWVRATHAFADHRASDVIDADDVMQAARVLLPGMDCPPRAVLDNDSLETAKVESTNSKFALGSAAADEQQCLDAIKRSMAFQMLMTGRRDLLPHAFQLLPPGDGRSADPISSVSNSSGYTPLQIAAIRGNMGALRVLLDTGANADGVSKGGGGDQETRSWTALTYAALAGQTKVVKYLLDRGASAEGVAAARSSSPGDQPLSLSVAPCESPLQVAAGAGHVRIVELLIAHGASPFVSAANDYDEPSPLSHQGCPSAVSVAAIHGHRRLLHVMVTQSLSLSKLGSGGGVSGLPGSGGGSHRGGGHNHNHLAVPAADEEEVLSLEEILAEGVVENIHSLSKLK